ncbi:dihydrofolate reductase [Streptomyces abyssalis]|uniref:Dihydrofolate reductase n=1 Tax=Streptomyces abyssalis TaxID=933944 RepID=A0A1E7JUS7_9ACTN|nr:2-hydroxyacid dehydrogenase [Streptomyces abyssalis]OEU89320.1 dihydrofolate reductase [Streptomyces abyssalis]OEU93707.1 dihydrofolate reductase [Streptomyces abyssalis]
MSDTTDTAVGVLLPWSGLDARHGPWPPNVRVHVWDGLTPEDELPAGVLESTALWVMPYAVPGAERLLPRLPAVRAVQSLSAGVEKLLPVMPEGARLYNGRGLHDASTAEHALGLMLAAQRDLPVWVADQQAGRWAPHFTRSLADSRVAVVGYGSIGQALEKRLLACEAEVVRVARRARPEEDVHAVTALPQLLPDVDIAVLVLPETPATAGLFGKAQLAALPDGALVVNVGRGRTLDTGALLEEVRGGRLRAALDVTDPEPLPGDHALRRQPGVLITPHVAGGSATFRPRAERLVVEQVRRYAAGEPLLNSFPRP